MFTSAASARKSNRTRKIRAISKPCVARATGSRLQSEPRERKELRNGIFLKLMAAFLLVILAAAVTFDLMLGGAWQASLRAEIERNLIQKTELLAHRVESDRSHSLADIAAQEGQAAGARVTIIDPKGQVLAD